MSERYQVRGRVGRGGMSAVYRAYDTVMGREVALKRLLPVEETNLNEDQFTPPGVAGSSACLRTVDLQSGAEPASLRNLCHFYPRY